MNIPKIDPKVFKKVRQSVVENKSKEILEETTILPIIKEAKGYPNIPQGIEIWYQNIPFPRKGFPDADIINALNIVKKDTISWLMGFNSKYLIPEGMVFALKPWSWKLKTVDSFLHGYIRKANYWLDFWYYQPPYYCPFALEIKNVIQFFLWKLGLNKDYSSYTALIFAMFLEHDDRFRLVPQDLISSTSKEALLKNPRKELKRIKKLLIEREPYVFTQQRIGSVLDLLSAALLIPQIKKAFKFAIREADFTKLQFDEGDEYWACRWGNYNAMGLNLEQRTERLKKWHEGLEPAPFAKVRYQ
jgi:hypothetical protein